MSATVTKLTSRPLVHLVDSPVAIKLLQHELLTAKVRYNAIAVKASVSSSTVSNIASAGDNHQDTGRARLAHNGTEGGLT